MAQLSPLVQSRAHSCRIVLSHAESLGKLMPTRAASGRAVPGWTISGRSVRVGPSQYEKAQNFVGKMCEVGPQAKACGLLHGDAYSHLRCSTRLVGRVTTTWTSTSQQCWRP